MPTDSTSRDIEKTDTPPIEQNSHVRASPLPYTASMRRWLEEAPEDEHWTPLAYAEKQDKSQAGEKGLKP